MTRWIAAIVTLFVVVVIALWIRHRAAQERRSAELARVVAAARAKDERRIAALREAFAAPMPASPRPCPIRARARIVRLDAIEEAGGSLHDVVAAAAESRDPSPWTHELDVVGGRSALYDYEAERVLCVGLDAEDPHGTLVAW